MSKPWLQIKIAFESSGNLERLEKAYSDKKFSLPEGWEFNETYSSPIAAIAICECENLPTEEECRTVRSLIKYWSK